VVLTDGRTQVMTISGPDGDGNSIAVHIDESRDGKGIRTEPTTP